MTYAENGTGGVEADPTQRSWRATGVEAPELTHDEVRNQLSDFLAGELEPADEARVRGHLAACALCAAYLATLDRTVHLLRTLPTRSAPDSLRRRLLAIPDDESTATR